MSLPVTPEISIKLKRLCYNLHVLRTCSEMKSILLALLFCLAFTCQLQAMNIKNATLVLLKDAPKKAGAMCLDGSPPGYFIRHGMGDGANKWILHMGGGAWCFNSKDCYNRSQTDLGSSKSWPKTTALNGFLSDNKKINPDFYDWNIVYLMYCDGASFASNWEFERMYKDKPLYYKGFKILKAILDDLLGNGMKNASDVILTGCSAGGLATYLHADFVHSYLPSGIKYKAFADAGYILDIPDLSGEPEFQMAVMALFYTQNVSGGVDQDCIKAESEVDWWRCFFAPYSFKYIQSPMFVLNSQYDVEQLKGILHLPCLPPDCTAQEMEYFHKFQKDFEEQIQPAINSTTSGVFIDSCLVHCQTLWDDTWDSFSVGGQTIRETFADWYFERSSGKTKEVDCATWPCNPTCKGVHPFPPRQLF